MHSRLRALRRRTEIRVIEGGSILRFGAHRIAADAAFAGVALLEVARLFIEAQTVKIIVRQVDEIEKTCHRRGLGNPRILRSGALAGIEVEGSGRAHGPAVQDVRRGGGVGLVVPVGVEVGVYVVSGGHGPVGGQPGVRKRDQLARRFLRVLRPHSALGRVCIEIVAGQEMSLFRVQEHIVPTGAVHFQKNSIRQNGRSGRQRENEKLSCDVGVVRAVRIAETGLARLNRRQLVPGERRFYFQHLKRARQDLFGRQLRFGAEIELSEHISRAGLDYLTGAVQSQVDLAVKDIHAAVRLLKLKKGQSVGGGVPGVQSKVFAAGCVNRKNLAIRR